MNNNILENLARASFEQTQERKLLLSEQELDQEVLKRLINLNLRYVHRKAFDSFRPSYRKK